MSTSADSPKYSHAELSIAGEYLHRLLHLPDDVHIVDVTYESLYNSDRANVVLHLEAFSSDEFPGQRVTAQFHDEYNDRTGRKLKTVFDGWESVD